MSDQESLQRLDFHNPRRPTRVEWRALTRWHQSVCLLTTEAWKDFLAQPVQLSAGDLKPVTSRTALLDAPDDSYGIQLAYGKDEHPSVMILTARQLHGVLADLLDLPGEEWPEVRPFTRGEVTALELLFQKLANSISEGIPGPQATVCRFVSMFENPERTRLFSRVDEVFSCEITVSSRFGDSTMTWLLPKKPTEQLLDGTQTNEDIDERPVNQQMIPLAQKVTTEVMVRLGQCRLTMSQISRLSVGDVLVLNQSIKRPLAGFVGKEKKWLGTPVRIGPRAGYTITELVDD